MMPDKPKTRIAAKGNFIDGKFRLAKVFDAVIEKRNPANLDDVIGAFPVVHGAVDEAVASAHSAQRGWEAQPLADRVNAIRKVRAAIVNRRDEFAIRIASEVGKPLWEARSEVQALLTKIDVTLESGLREVADVVPEGLRGAYRYRPYGVFAILGPFNFPAHLAHGQVVAAIVTGNTVVMKPSEVTPGVGQLYAEAFEESHLPRGVFNMVQGDGGVGRALATHARVAGVMFTGSVATGRAIAAACVDEPGKMLALEMGGKNAAIVLDDADLDVAVHECLVGGYITSGQRCTASSRVIVTRKIADEFVRRFAERVRGIRVGDPFAPDVFMGPLATERGLSRFVEAVARGRAEGAVPIVEGGRVAERPGGYFVAPSLHEVALRRKESVYQREELFGPDVAVYRVKNLEAAFEVANDSEFGLVASVFTADAKRYRDAYAHLRAGLINWNRTTVGSSPKLPFGGTGLSGNHRAAGLHAIRWCVYPVSSLEEPAGHPDEYPGLVAK